MLNINKNEGQLVGRILHNGEVVGTCSTAESFYDVACQIKENRYEGYALEVDTEAKNGYKRTLHYDFNPDGTLNPTSQGGVKLWHDIIDEKLLYLHNFINNYGKERY